MATPEVIQQWLQNQLYSPLSVSLLLLFLILLYKLTKTPGSNNRLPPSPPRLPIIGHLHRISKFPHKSLHELSRKYGDIMLLHLGPTPTVVVSSARVAKEIMKTHDTVFANRPAMSAAKAFVSGDKDIGFAPYGEYWREVRKIFVTDLLTAKRRHSFRLVREEEISNMVSRIKLARAEGSESVVNVNELVTDVVMNFVTRVAFGKSLEKGSKHADLPKQVSEILRTFCVGDVFPYLGWIDILTGFDSKLKRVSGDMNQFLDGVIDEHLMSRNDETRDFVDTLIEHQREGTSAVELTRENFKALMFDMFVGGTDNVITTFEWAMAEAFNQPEIMKKLQNEVRGVIGTKGKVDEDDVSRMGYLHCVVKETLRLHPPSTLIMPRVSTASATIEGYHVPAKTQVYTNAWAIARDPEMWEKAEEFIPERFIDSQVDFKGQDFQFIPFGGGRRVCPAISFASVSVEAILANVIYWFDWKLPTDAVGTKIDMTEAIGATNRLKYPMYLIPIVKAKM